MLARNRRLAPKLRRALSELENGMSDVTLEEIRGLIEERLGKRLTAYAVELEPAILSEASVSAVIRFTWNHPGREREQGVFKVLKPYVPECFGEDRTLLQDLGEFLTFAARGYAFELVILDWALAERLNLESRRQLVLLSVRMTLRNPEGVRQAIGDLALSADSRNHAHLGVIESCVQRFFEQLPPDASPGTLDAMRLLDRIALEGVHFPPPLFLFRKIVLTLDGVLYDVAGPGVRIDDVIAREFLTRCAASLGIFHAPLEWKDIVAIEWNALVSPLRRAGLVS